MTVPQVSSTISISTVSFLLNWICTENLCFIHHVCHILPGLATKVCLHTGLAFQETSITHTSRVYNVSMVSSAAPADYARLDQVSVSFISSPSSQCVNVSVFVDGVVEGVESLRIALDTNDTAVSLGQPESAEVVIINTDGKFCTCSGYL